MNDRKSDNFLENQIFTLLCDTKKKKKNSVMAKLYDFSRSFFINLIEQMYDSVSQSWAYQENVISVSCWTRKSLMLYSWNLIHLEMSSNFGKILKYSMSFSPSILMNSKPFQNLLTYMSSPHIQTHHTQRKGNWQNYKTIFLTQINWIEDSRKKNPYERKRENLKTYVER